MDVRMTRREFIYGAAAGVPTFSAAAGASEEKAASANDRLNLGIIGVNGRGAQNLAGVRSENIVALCDVDTNRANEARAAHPRASFYQDFRRLLDQKGIDAVVISTPDHMHAIPAVAAMQAGKHVYCEKPLAHSVHEVRVMMATAARNKVVTQMGTQIHAGANYRRVVEIVQSGVLGPIRRVQVWCEKKPRPGQRASTETKPPASLDYDLWLGPAPYRPYHETHAHYHWRWWWDFGGGILADMACHYLDLPYWALDLRSPTTVSATGQVTYEGENQIPDLMLVDYDYPARGEQPAVRLTWYHGVKGPDLSGKVAYAGFSSGVRFEGDKGQLLADYNHWKLLPDDEFRGFSQPSSVVPKSQGHHREWLEAIKRGGPTTCDFGYGGPLAEAVLLGNVAYRIGTKIEWDAKAGKATNVPEAEQFLRREYRKGWQLG